MKKLSLLIFSLALAACGESDQKTSIGSKADQDKGMAVIDARQRALMESDKILGDELEKIEREKASSAKATGK